MDVRNRQVEIAYLRASMSRLRDDLDQQRRLNVCLKERKVRWLYTLYTFALNEQEPNNHLDR